MIKKYKRAEANLELLNSFGAQLLHGVDAMKMKLHTDLQMRKFDRIVYNFPHAGFLGNEDDNRVITYAPVTIFLCWLFIFVSLLVLCDKTK